MAEEVRIQIVNGVKKAREAAARKIASALAAFEAEQRWVEWRDENGKKKPITPGTRRAAEVSNRALGAALRLALSSTGMGWVASILVDAVIPRAAP